jgi:hypothetical protein
MMMLFDTVDTSGARLTQDGYLVADAKVARTGIQMYRAGELGLDGDQDRMVPVYRPPEEVFSVEAMASYAHRPVTDDHPTSMVDASNWKQHAKGQTGDEVMRDGDFVRVPILLMDGDSIQKWQDGKKELSMGYTMDLEVADGESPEGEKYEAIQRNLRMNHLALVSRARGGSELRLGDRKPEENSMELKTITVDGFSVETTEAGAQAISKLTTELADARKVTEDQQAAHSEALAGKDRELAAKDAEIDSLKGKILSDEDLDKRVTDRADLIAAAKQIADKDYTGMPDSDIRKAAVVAKLGEDAVDGRSDDYIQARFDILSEDAEQDGVRRVLRTGDTKPTDDVSKAHDAYVDDLHNSWKNKEGA